MLKVYISFSENVSVGKCVCRKICPSENLTVEKCSCRKICRRKICVRKFAVGKIVSENLLSEKPPDTTNLVVFRFVLERNRFLFVFKNRRPTQICSKKVQKDGKWCVLEKKNYHHVEKKIHHMEMINFRFQKFQKGLQKWFQLVSKK